MLVLRLAFLEFFRSCSRRAPGGRDFLWMSLLMMFVQLLALTIFSAREGVLERSVDAFLGNRPGYGIPVWTLPNFLGRSDPLMITNELVDEVTDAGFHGAPFRRLYGGELVRLPGRNLWRAAHAGSQPDFSGMAVDFDGPLYPGVGVRVTGPHFDGAWPIILDENLFKIYFDLEGYRAALTGLIPEDELAKIPSDPQNVTDMSVLWMHVRVHRREVLAPFNIHWSKYFGVGSDDTAFQIPLEMFNAYKVAQENSDLCVFLDGGPDYAPRIMSAQSGLVLTMSKEERAAFTEKLNQIAAYFGIEARQRGTRIMLDFATEFPARGNGVCDGGVPGLLFSLIADQVELELDGDKLAVFSTTDGFKAEVEHVQAPCGALNDGTLENATREGAEGSCLATISMADPASGYAEMVLYAQNRLEIRKLVEYLNCRVERGPGRSNPLIAPEANPNLCVLEQGEDPESRLMINQIYEDSLKRFGFLTELLKGVSGPIGGAMLLLLVAILWVQIGTVLGHRRVRYAMMLSNGLSWRQIKVLVMSQMITGAAIGLIIALAILTGVKFLLLAQMAGISQDYEMITLGKPIDVLPVHPMMIALVFVAMLVIAIVLTVLQLRQNGMSARVALERLLS